jgi:fermentation-respiration switch protein FrsA (DUF1100 family)
MTAVGTPERFDFVFDEVNLIGDLHIPRGDARGLIVMSGPFASTRRQATHEYATRLARQGYVALSFDHRCFGESGGEPRQCENPLSKIDDVRAAVHALSQDPRFSSLPIFAVGICAGAGYMAWAVADEPLFAAYAGVAGYYAHFTPETLRAARPSLVRALAAARRWSREGINETIPAVSDSGGERASPLPEAFEYYGTTRGMRPGYVNAVAIQSGAYTIPFDAMGAAEQITVPTLLIHAENAIAPLLMRDFASQMKIPPRTIWLRSRNQIDFYDDPMLIDSACEAIDRFFSAVITER